MKKNFPPLSKKSNTPERNYIIVRVPIITSIITSIRSNNYAFGTLFQKM